MMNGFAEHAIVKNTFDEASAILGQDLWAMINGSDAEIIGQTVNTQPIMLAVSVAVYRAYLEVGGKTPAAVAGHSLGEYTALVAAEALDFADAVKLVRLRAELMQSAVPQGVGAMAKPFWVWKMNRSGRFVPNPHRAKWSKPSTSTRPDKS